MNKIKTLPLIAILAMTVLSFTNLFGLNLAQYCIFVGLAFFFIDKIIEKTPSEQSGLDLKAIGRNLKDKKIWVWLVLPILVDAICITISMLFVPEYIEFETNRAGGFVAVEISIPSILLFLVFALGEEIAWRAFFQQQLNKKLPLIPVLLISSLLFTLGHYSGSSENLGVVIFGLIFTFINSILYGVVFYKSKNAWISTLSHYIANMFEVVLLVILLG